MKLSDYVFKFLADLGIDTVFMVVGGANSNLADALSKNNRLKYIPMQHEQAAAMAAEGYARASAKIGVAMVTSGPGGTNALTGVCGAWCDSIPCIFISGQVVSNLNTDGKTIRQLGVQQINIVDIVKPVTKYAICIKDPQDICYELEKAFYISTHGRPGPVWIDIPADFQRAEIKILKGKQFIPCEPPLLSIKDKVKEFLKMAEFAKRPVLIIGHGIRLADAVSLVPQLIDKLGFPVITTWNGIDLINHNHHLYIGCAGSKGGRGTNFAVANSDLILSIGSRMDTRQVGNNPNLYARAAKKIVVDIDRHELEKNLIKIDLPIQTDAKKFIIALLEELGPELTSKYRATKEWLNKCYNWNQRYPNVRQEYFDHKSDGINSYAFIATLCGHFRANGNNYYMVVTDMGTSLTCTMQSFFVNQNRRIFSNTGFASMGFGLPATIGAYFGSRDKNCQIIGIYGDGGFQMNIQELQTVVHNKIPIKMFILNNNAYLTIEHTQENFFDGNYVGSNPQSGYSTPKFKKIATAYGIKSYYVNTLRRLEKILPSILQADEPVLCEIKMQPNQPLIPLSLVDKSHGYVGASLERMYPFLSEEEFLENMIIPVI